MLKRITALKAKHLIQGEEAESACCTHLKKQGLKLLEKNFRCRFGEIDLVMRQGETLVFVEVRFRQNPNYGGGLESVTPAKQQKLRKTAEYYLQQNPRYENARFDVVAMSKNSADRGKSHYTYNWIQNAF